MYAKNNLREIRPHHYIEHGMQVPKKNKILSNKNVTIIFETKN